MSLPRWFLLYQMTVFPAILRAGLRFAKPLLTTMVVLA
jgi:hypothetical protein